MALPTLPPFRPGEPPPSASAASSLVAPLNPEGPPGRQALPPLAAARLPPLPGTRRTPAATPAVPQPAAVLPGSAPRARPPARVQQPPTRVIAPGDLICGECGEGNDAARKFCSRCGATLAQAQTMKPPPWYRRIFTRAPRRPAAGAPANRRRAFTMSRAISTLRNLSFVVLFVGGIAYGLSPGLRNGVNDNAVRAKSWAVNLVSPSYEPVHPIRATASSEVPGHLAGQAIDNFKKTYWAADTKSDGQPVLILDFDQPVSIDRILLTSGNQSDFQSVGRPQKLHLVFFTRNDSGQTVVVNQDASLNDRQDAQDVTIESQLNVTRIEIHITALFRAPNSSQVATAEVELFKRQ